jgi:hypothetical protein
MHSLSALVLLGASLVSTAQAIGPDCANGPLKSNKICDVKASPSDRAAALVAAMQTQEKLDNLMRYGIGLEYEDILELTDTANRKASHDLAFRHTTGGEKHSTVSRVRRVSTSHRPSPLPHRSQCHF